MKKILSILLRPFPVDIFKLKDFPETRKKWLSLFILRLTAIMHLLVGLYFVFYLAVVIYAFGMSTLWLSFIEYIITCFLFAFTMQKFFFLAYIVRCWISFNGIFFAVLPVTALTITGLIQSCIAIICYLYIRKALVKEQAYYESTPDLEFSHN